jgi:hypothetical protein
MSGVWRKRLPAPCLSLEGSQTPRFYSQLPYLGMCGESAAKQDLPTLCTMRRCFPPLKGEKLSPTFVSQSVEGESEL